MNNINYVEGNLTEFEPVGRRIIVNVCNEVGIWQGANAKDITKRWPQARANYLSWYRSRMRNDFALGAVQFVHATCLLINQRTLIANLVAQTEVTRPIRYRPFRSGFLQIGKKAFALGATVHMQSPTTDQADSWPDLVDIVERTLCSNGLQVFVYVDLEIKGPRQVAASVVNFK